MTAKWKKAWPLISLLAGLGTANRSWSSELKSSCYLLDKAGQVSHGLNTQARLEIASVSKVMTTYWALSNLGLNYRFQSQIHILPVGEDLVDIHIEGSQDPFFNREQLQFVISELNAQGIFNVRNLSFDEKFKFLMSTRGNSAAESTEGNAYPEPEIVKEQLEIFFRDVNGLYSATRLRAKNIAKMVLLPALQFRVQKLVFLSSIEFQKRDASSSSGAQQFGIQSVPLQSLLKEMNRASNNYVANIIFNSQGGASEFQKFILEKAKLSERQIRFLNGSGNRNDFPDGSFAYNEASCEAILTVIKSLKTEVDRQQGDLANILSVAGRDPEGEPSVLSRIYSTESTSGALVAKTGTVNPSVALAGMALTTQGPVFFGTIYGTEGTAEDWREARGKIRQDLNQLFRDFGNKKEIDYEATKFMTFDSLSSSRAQSIGVRKP